MYNNPGTAKAESSEPGVYEQTKEQTRMVHKSLSLSHCMKATSIKAILLAASLTLSSWGIAQTTGSPAIVYTARGLAKAIKGDSDGAIADFNTAIKLDPTLVKAYEGRGVVKQQKGDLDGAMADFNAAINLNPKLADAYEGRGLVKQQKGDLDGAASDYNRALELDPKLADAYAGRGDIKFIRDDRDGAIADYSRALKFNPKLASIYCNRGVVKQRKGDVDGAIADYSQTLKLNPKFVHAYSSRGNANFLAHNWTDALRDYRLFCDSSKENQEYQRLFIWLIRSRLSERQAANKELAAYFKAAPGSWASKVAAYFLGSLSDVDLLAAAASRDPKTDRGQHCEAWFYVGMKKFLAGDKPGAADCFKKCLATEQEIFTEYQFAKAELKALGHT
jgi:lipoprotein NlpI